MIPTLVARLDPSERVCARLVSRHHLGNRGRNAAYVLSGSLEEELGLAQITVRKSVGSLSPADLSRMIHDVRRGTKTGRTASAEFLFESGALELSGRPETDRKILALAAITNDALEGVNRELEGIQDPLVRMEKRRSGVRSIFSLTAQEAMRLSLGESVSPEGLALGVVGSYNHAPLRTSDFDFVLMCADSRYLAAARAFLAALERVFALTILDASNFVTVNSGGRLDVIDMKSFERRGFSLFPKSLSIKMGLADITFLAGDETAFRHFHNIGDSWLERQGNSFMDGARLHRIIAKEERAGERSILRKARLLEKATADALLVTKIRTRTRGNCGCDYGELIHSLARTNAIPPSFVLEASDNIRISRIACESLGETCSAAQTRDVRAQMEGILDSRYGTAKTFFDWACDRARLSGGGVRLAGFMFALRDRAERVKQRYWYRGRGVKPEILTGGAAESQR